MKNYPDDVNIWDVPGYRPGDTKKMDAEIAGHESGLKGSPPYFMSEEHVNRYIEGDEINDPWIQGSFNGFYTFRAIQDYKEMKGNPDPVLYRLVPQYKQRFDFEGKKHKLQKRD